MRAATSSTGRRLTQHRISYRRHHRLYNTHWARTQTAQRQLLSRRRVETAAALGARCQPRTDQPVPIRPFLPRRIPHRPRGADSHTPRLYVCDRRPSPSAFERRHVVRERHCERRRQRIGMDIGFVTRSSSSRRVNDDWNNQPVVCARPHIVKCSARSGAGRRGRQSTRANLAVN